MRDQSFTKNSLERMIRNHDYTIVANLKLIQHTVIEQAYQKALRGRSGPFGVTANVRNKKAVYKINNFSDELLIRKITQNVKRVTSAKQQNRDRIINNLKRLLEEGVTYRVYRLDIKDFYGSVDASYIVSRLKADWNVSRPTIEFIENILNQPLGRGLPRGLPLSATLAEYVMQPFDTAVENHDDTYFYSRFVDDIIIITSGSEDVTAFVQNIRSHLAPFGLRLNSKKAKQSIQLVMSSFKGARDLLHSFNFLGYSFKIFNNGRHKHGPHDVEIDISTDKIKKMKTKIISAFLDFIDNGNFLLLTDRIKLLTGNYYVRDKHNLAKRTAGIFYSYRHANVKIEDQCAVRKLDTFLQHTLLSNQGKISTKLNILLNKNQKKLLLKRSFAQGYKSKKFHHFSPIRLGQIMGCWRYD